MSRIPRLVVLWYIALTVLALFGAHTLTVSDIFAGLVLTWTLGLVFVLAFVHWEPPTMIQSASPQEAREERRRVRFLVLASVMSVAISILLIRFYTGNTPSQVFVSLLQQESLYHRYQTYFQEQELWRFSLQKVPVVLLSALLKLSLVYTFISVLALRRSLTAGRFVILVVTGASYLLFSAARGTSFELFELFLLIGFSLTIRGMIWQADTGSRRKSSVVLLALAVAFLTLYSYNISTRFGTSLSTYYCVTLELCKNPESLLYLVSPALGELSFLLAGYFSFGIFFSSSFISSIWSSSFSNLIRGLFPLGFTGSYGIREGVCDRIIDCGSAWMPDSMVLLQYLGVVGLVALTFALGRIARLLTARATGVRDLYAAEVLYFVVLAMFSLPVGNFLLISSSNILSFIVILAFYFWSRSVNNRKPRIQRHHGYYRRLAP
ncbi:MAG: hypothetical protein BWY63_00927 [Chloroflexi bacterium ADurb.Bin360]|nr:MAG: hypothetical protein BWY63_00927 [Chloroflexi bacterium ADurb.Bin360]